MSYEGQYQNLKIIAKRMLIEVGIIVDEDFDDKVSEMAVSILEDLYNQQYSTREINNAITILKAASRLY